MHYGHPTTVAKLVVHALIGDNLERIGSRSQSRLCIEAVRTCGP